MSPLTDHGAAVQETLRLRYALSPDVVLQMMVAVVRGGGRQAQFNIPELGGMGQWSAGGMTMVGDMFNNALQATVSGLCADIAQAMTEGPLFKPETQPVHAGQSQAQRQGGGPGDTSMTIKGGGGAWWPAELGSPSSQGSQNNLHYAIFPQAHRLAINLNGHVTVYDTGDHLIGGISQQQSGDASWTFTSQFGTVRLDQLRVVSGGDGTPHAPPAEPAAAKAAQPAPAPEDRQPEPPADTAPAAQGARPAAREMSSDEVFSALEKLGSLRDAGILTDEEFAAKKAELLSRL